MGQIPIEFHKAFQSEIDTFEREMVPAGWRVLGIPTKQGHIDIIYSEHDGCWYPERELDALNLEDWMTANVRR